MKRIAFTLLLLSAACGGERSVASKSAAAYREAQEKGIAVGAGDGHHHAAAPGGSVKPATATDHGAHDDPASAQHSSMEHGEAQHATSGHVAGHTAVQHATAGHAQDTAPSQQHTQHATTGAQHTQHTSPTAAHTEHAPPTAQHTQHAPGPPSAPRLPRPGTPTEMQRIDPAATLQPDPFDTPAPASVAEAAKASQPGSAHKGH